MLMPSRVWLRERADVVERLHLFPRQLPRGGGEIVAKLLFIPRPDDDRVDGWLAHDPVQRDL